MTENSKGFYYAATFLGQHFKISKGILKKTACMSIDERLLIADLDGIVQIWDLLDDIGEMTIPDLIKKIIEPIVQNEGFAKWQRDVVTDMAIRKGDTTKESVFKQGGKATDKDSEVSQ